MNSIIANSSMIGKRFIGTVLGGFPNEYKILEVSPSGLMVKVMYPDTKWQWINFQDVNIIEILPTKPDY